ncbi:MAG: serine/threonine-protein kinase, partial [Terriglobales bacterium]
MNHSTQSLLRIESIFHEALAAAGGQARSKLIEARCSGDAALVAEVLSLLKACEAEELESAARRPDSRNSSSELPERKRIGPYEIDRLLGRGGMGAVYLAHRADGQFEQRVAIKVIDLPLATNLFRERFRQERQILAGLQHPLIARLLDGGVTAGGDLYLAMEYVDGVPIHRYCDAKGFTLRQRLAVFKSVCEAVQFAHQNLVVHRDLKPDN